MLSSRQVEGLIAHPPASSQIRPDSCSGLGLPQGPIDLAVLRHPAGELFCSRPRLPAYSVTAHATALEKPARYAQARNWTAERIVTHCGINYRAIAQSIPFLQALDENLQGAGPIFVRMGRGHRPDVAAAKIDVLLALGQQGAQLFELLATPSVRQQFVEANGVQAAESVQVQACSIFAQAHDELQSFATGLAGYAMAKIQHPFLSLEQADSSALPPQLLAQHMQALAWAPGAGVGGELCRGPLVQPNQEGWFHWRQGLLAKIRGFMGPELRKALQPS